VPNRFEYTDWSGDKLTVLPAKGGILVEAENAPHVPLDRVEEVIAGIRDLARQAGRQPAPQPLTVRINIGDEAALQTAIRDILRRSGSEGAGA
jgi:hypothetical protein